MEDPQTHEPLLVTPRELFLAIRYSDVEKVRTLLDNGADANWRNRRGDESALEYAALMGNEDVFHLLFLHGACDTGDYLLVEAINGGNLEIVEFLLRRRTVTQEMLDSLLQEAAHDGYSEVITFLLGQGADPNVAAGTKSNPEALARQHGHEEAADMLRTASQSRRELS
ncbi:MAG: ankyrin repeat domain-containing protein [Armatimonadota bacterium]